ESKHSKIFATTDFFYRTITVERPLRLSYAVRPERIEQVMAARQVTKLKEPEQAALRAALQAAAEESAGAVSTSRAEFTDSLTTTLAAHDSPLSPALLKVVLAELGEHDDAGELV